MIATIALATHLTAHACVIESRDRVTVRAGHLATFEVGDTCLMRGLRVTITDGAQTLTGTNTRAGHDLIVAIRIPRSTHHGDVFYARSFTPHVVFHAITILK